MDRRTDGRADGYGPTGTDRRVRTDGHGPTDGQAKVAAGLSIFAFTSSFLLLGLFLYFGFSYDSRTPFIVRRLHPPFTRLAFLQEYTLQRSLAGTRAVHAFMRAVSPQGVLTPCVPSKFSRTQSGIIQKQVVFMLPRQQSNREDRIAEFCTEKLTCVKNPLEKKTY